MRDCKAIYREWLASVTDDALKRELLSMSGREIDDAFFQDLSFGTGGLRGVMAAGTNRMNRYTVGRATRGLGWYLLATCPNSPRVAIGYDSRRNSEAFARLAAVILADMGIRVFFWGELLPTPMLSFAVRALDCTAGIMLTASHNPAEYNGYKVYNADGCQITEEAAAAISASIARQADFGEEGEKHFDELLASGAISYIDDSVYESYLTHVMQNSMQGDKTQSNKELKVVYTPLNGTGRRPVLDVLCRRGFLDVSVVREQEAPDGNFPTCPYPNPEIPSAMQLGLDYAHRLSADLLIATDPDCDRVGVGARDADGDYTLLTGNEIGLLLLEYICRCRLEKGRMPAHPRAVKTIVTTDLAQRIATRYGVSMVNVLTGFKYIGESIGALEREGRARDFILGFEESCGYLTADYVRDKDGVLAAMLICEMASYYKQRGMTLCDAMSAIYQTYGYCQNTLKSYTLDGAKGIENMHRIMEKLRMGLKTIGGLSVEKMLDYQKGIDGLPTSNVLKFLLAGGSSFTVRPSGTEPKLKLYLSVSASTRDAAVCITNELICDFERIMHTV